jgi:hypothetical protein
MTAPESKLGHYPGSRGGKGSKGKPRARGKWRGGNKKRSPQTRRVRREKEPTDRSPQPSSAPVRYALGARAESSE